MSGTIIPFPGTTAIPQPQPRPPTPQAPCKHRQVTADGRVTCHKVPRGAAEVTPALCATCPATLIDCQHLRFTLRKHAPVPIVVRYAGGRTEVWDNMPPTMCFAQAACVLRREAVGSPADCAGCTLRMAIPAAPATNKQRRSVATR